MSKDNGIPPVQRQKWQVVSKTLLQIHKTLMDWQFAEMEKVSGAITNPSHRLNLLLNDEGFQWMRWLSRLVTQIDHVLDSKKVIDPQSWENHRTEWLASFHLHTTEHFKDKLQSMGAKYAYLSEALADLREMMD